MSAREGWWFVPFEPGPQTVIRIGWISAALGFLIAIVSGIGELVGWWDLLGEVGIGVGSLLGIVATFTTLSFTAGRRQVRAVRETMRGVEATVDANNAVLSENNELLSESNEKLDKLDKLDVIEAELNRQTGALGRQLEVLEAIRDGI